MKFYIRHFLNNYLMMCLIIGLPILLVVLIMYATYQDNKCKESGGIATRIGCVKSDIFLEIK